MRLKLLLMAMCAVLCLLALCMGVNAEEYTVSTSDEFKTAFSSATNGDTIVIKGNIVADLNFGKSITYIIDGGYTWSAGASAPENGHDVSVYARNGNAVFMPNTGMWMNSYESDVVGVSQTTWTLGSLDGSTLTFDMVETNIRLLYGVSFEEINFKNGVTVTNCNNNDVRDTKYFAAATVNIYEGTEFYGIYVAPYRGFFDCTTLNIYGGEIHGCYFGEYGMALAKTVNMYGGKIHDIYLNFENTGVVEGLFKNAALNMYGGEIYDNYVKASSISAHSVLAGNKDLVGGSVHDNYVFTSWETTPTLNANGEYEIAGLDTSAATEAGYGKGNTTVYDYSVIFKNANSSVISAYMVKDGAIKSTLADATEVTIPAGYSFANTIGGCMEVTPDTSKQGTYYVASSHTFASDDFNCETADTCSVCSYEAPAMSHAFVEAVDFANGYDNKGSYTKDCTNVGCTACDEKRELGAVIVSLGYSVSERETGFFSVTQGFVLDSASIELINSLSNKRVADLGVLVAVKDSLDRTDVFENGELTATQGVLTHSLFKEGNSYIDVKITGLEGENEKGRFEEMELFLSAYLTLESGEAVDTLYVDEQGITNELTHSVTYSSFFIAE